MDSITAAGFSPDDDSGNEGAEEEWVERARRRSAPENEVPATVPCASYVTRTDEASMAIVGLLAFSTGLRFTVEIRRRHGEVADDHPRRFRSPDDALLLGAQFADGRRGSTLDQPECWGAPAAEPCLSPEGGSWGGRSGTLGYFLSPYPPPGDLLLVAAWPAADVPEARFVVPAQALATARDQVVELWPWEPEPEIESGDDEFHSPALPEGSWFAEDGPTPR